MHGRTLNIFTIIIFSVVGLLFLINIRNYLVQGKPEPFVAQNNVRGIAVEHKKKLYTLSFDQQKDIVDFFNASLPAVGMSQSDAKETPAFGKIMIYLFNGGTVEVVPLGWVDQSLVFSAPAWRPEGYLKDTSNGKLYDLLNNSYDP